MALHRDKVNYNLRYPVQLHKERISGIHNPEVGPAEDRYDTGDKNRVSAPIPNSGWTVPRVMINEPWFRWSPERQQIMRIEVRTPIGSRYRIASPGVNTRTIVVLPNPVGQVQETVGKGYETLNREVRMGSFRAKLNEINLARRRR